MGSRKPIPQLLATISLCHDAWVNFLTRKSIALAPWFVLLVIWEMAGRLGFLSKFILPWPSLVFSSLAHELMSGALVADMASSLLRVMGGFAAAVVLGTALGFAIALSQTLARVCNPVLNFLRPIPPVAWVPLAIVWFGIGNAPAFFLTFVAAFFPIVLNAAEGVRSIPEQHFQVAACLQAPPRLVFRRVIWPGALPQLFTGYRVGFGVAWMAVVAAEMIAARSGLGHLIQVSQDVLRTDLVVAGMATIGFIGIACDWLLLQLARRAMPWERA
jgi:NitT/TauT family transport system permease protein